jgi:hypothetical protein
MNKTKKPEMPKFIHFSAHAESLEYIFQGLSIPKQKKAAPGSAMFIEFFEKDDDLFVRFFFKHNASAPEQILKLPS